MTLRGILRLLVVFCCLALSPASLARNTVAQAHPLPAENVPSVAASLARLESRPALPSAAARLSATTTYTITHLGRGRARAINDLGQVAVESFDSLGLRAAIVWDQGSVTVLGSNGLPLGINNAGRVVGSSLRGINPVAVVWTGGAEQDLPLPSDAFQSGASDINDQAQIVGVVSLGTEDGATAMAVMWDAAGMRSLGSNWHPYAINEAGVVVGYDAQWAPMKWENGVHQPLPLPPGASTGGAFDLNDSGQIVGQADAAAVLWDATGVHGLGFDGIGWAINNQGQVVGEYDSSQGRRGFLWQDGAFTDLNTLLPPGSGWVIEVAEDINERGQIVGFGMFSGAEHAFLLTPDPQPIVFVPGMAGSVLRDADNGNREVWPAPFSFHDRLSLFPEDQPSPGIYASDALRSVRIVLRIVPIYGPLLSFLAANGYPEYQVADNPSRRTTAGCDLSQQSSNPRLFVFAYDWRRSNVESADRLKDFVGCVQRFYPDAKINIVAHSNGGLVARRYILDNPADHRVNQFISIGSPFLGAAKFPYVMETGDFVPFITGATTRRIVASFTGAHQLAPGPAYFAIGGPRPLGEDGRDVDGDGSASGDYDYATYKSVVNAQYGLGGLLPADASQAFHSYGTSVGNQDDWRTDQSGVSYHHIYGIQSTDRTIGNMRYTYEVRCVPAGLWVLCDRVPSVSVQYTAGDGTVPIASAARRGPGGDYNAPSASLLSFTGGSDMAVEHNGLNSNPAVQAAVLAILRGEPPTRSTPARAGSDLAASGQAYYLTASGMTGFTISDDQGRSTGPLTGAPAPRGEVPGADALILGADRFSAVLDPIIAYSVTFTTTASPLNLALTLGTGVTATHALRYVDAVVPAGSAARLALSGSGHSELTYDGDGDGVYDVVVPPGYDLSGPAANDLEAPQIVAQVAPAVHPPSISLQATDTGSGVARLLYSLDGALYQPYTGTFTAPATGAGTVYAFADDHAGNRGVLSLELAARQVYLPLVTR